MFEVDLARVIEIAVIRVQMFDGTHILDFGSDESKRLFREYRTIRRKYDKTPLADTLQQTSHFIWDYYPDI